MFTTSCRSDARDQSGEAAVRRRKPAKFLATRAMSGQNRGETCCWAEKDQIDMSPEPRTKRRILLVLDWTLRAVAALTIAMLLYLVFESIRFSYVSPPRDMLSIADFRKWRPDLTDAVKISVRGNTYYAVRGPFARSLPSAHSEFYFDSNGTFLTWNRDVGDFSDPRILHPGTSSRESISVTDIPNKD